MQNTELFTTKTVLFSGEFNPQIAQHRLESVEFEFENQLKLLA